MDEFERKRYITTLIIRRALESDKLSQEIQDEIHNEILIKILNEET